MAPWVTGPSVFDGDDDDEVRFVVDNDVDHEQVLRPLQGHGFRVTALPPNLRDKSDSEARAWARDQTRILITHDQDDWYKRNFDAGENPGIIVIPRDGDGVVDFPLIASVLNIVRSHRGIFDATVLEITPDGSMTLWNPNLETGEIRPISVRVREDNYGLEVWESEAGEAGVAPDGERTGWLV